ncbi:MAG: ABC transporter permease [Planctomycetaceae bacterium]|nr:ABC transporter permease [Planctomycetaceae bacterium]
MLRFAFSNLLNRKARSTLALLGLTVAIAGMVGLFSIVEGLDRITEDTFSRIPGILVMQTGAPIPLFSRLPAEWEDDLKNVKNVKIVCPEIWVRVNVLEGKMIINPPRFLLGVDIELWNSLGHALYRDDLVEGRFLTNDDIGTRNVVLAKLIQSEMKLELGESFSINGQEATLVGVYETGSILIDMTIIMDIGSLRDQSRFDPTAISAFYVEAVDDDLNEQVIDDIRDAFRGRKGDRWAPSSVVLTPMENPLETMIEGLDRWLKSASSANPSQLSKEPESPPEPLDVSPAKENIVTEKVVTEDDLEIKKHLQVDESIPIDVQTADAWGEKFGDFMSELDFIMFILTSIGMTIAALGVVNTMLMSVSERIIEIGILKANGWSKKHVLSLISFESGFLGLGGGCLGCLFGWIATLIVNVSFPDRVELYASPQLLCFSLFFSVVLGLFAGLYPAIWAMRMMPMDAIRRG